MTAVSSAALVDAAMEACRNHAAWRTPETWSAFAVALDRFVSELVALLDSERQAREKAERDAAIKDRAMTDYFAEASQRAYAAEAARDRLTEALNALDLAAGYYRRELKEILAHCEDDDQSLAISKIRAHAQDAIRAADASLAAAGSEMVTYEELRAHVTSPGMRIPDPDDAAGSGGNTEEQDDA